MTEKKSTAKKAPKAKPKAEATEPKKVEKKATPAPKKSKKKPSWINKGVTEFVTGTQDYRELVTEANKIQGTHWNPWRVKPAVFYTCWATVRKHYGVE